MRQVYFNLLVILLVNFHVHCWLLFTKRVHLKDSSAKKDTSTENKEAGLTPPLPPCSEGAVYTVASICQSKLTF